MNAQEITNQENEIKEETTNPNDLGEYSYHVKLNNVPSGLTPKNILAPEAASNFYFRDKIDTNSAIEYHKDTNILHYNNLLIAYNLCNHVLNTIKGIRLNGKKLYTERLCICYGEYYNYLAESVALLNLALPEFNLDAYFDTVIKYNGENHFMYNDEKMSELFYRVRSIRDTTVIPMIRSTYYDDFTGKMLYKIIIYKNDYERDDDTLIDYVCAVGSEMMEIKDIELLTYDEEDEDKNDSTYTHYARIIPIKGELLLKQDFFFIDTNTIFEEMNINKTMSLSGVMKTESIDEGIIKLYDLYLELGDNK